jgi:hypothetical protein
VWTGKHAISSPLSQNLKGCLPEVGRGRRGVRWYTVVRFLTALEATQHHLAYELEPRLTPDQQADSVSVQGRALLSRLALRTGGEMPSSRPWQRTSTLTTNW